MQISEYNYLRKCLHKIEKKYFRVTKNCYHFTDKDAYFIIKESKKFRITNKKFVKDKEDITYPETVLKECLKELGSEEWAEQEYFKFWGEHFIDNLYCFSVSYENKNSYVSSSKEYGNYSIKVNTKRMFKELKKDKNIQIIKMGYTIYNPREQRRILIKFLKLYYRICELLKETDIFNETNNYSPSKLEYECKQYIIFLLDLIKKSNFSKEKEVRIVFMHNDISKDEFSKTEEDLKYYYAENIDKYSTFLIKQIP